MDNIQEQQIDPVLLRVEGLKKYFPVKQTSFGQEKKFVKAVDDVSFQLYRGETLGLVGESGCGKSTVGRSILRLTEATEGKIFFEGTDIRTLDKNSLRKKRRDFQIIFQDPFSSLDPRFKIGKMLREPLQIQRLVPAGEMPGRIAAMLEMVGIRPDSVTRYPHEFSGGQRQRLNIARALMVSPKMLVCDECVSALDVSIQAQIINLLMRLQREMNLSYLFISHDLRVVKHISNRIAVMYLGTLVELADKKELFDHPAHPYTQMLLSAIPTTDPDAKRDRALLNGDVPSPINVPSGCRFHTRCSRAQAICEKEVPPFVDLGCGHFCACHFPDK